MDKTEHYVKWNKWGTDKYWNSHLNSDSQAHYKAE